MKKNMKNATAAEYAAVKAIKLLVDTVDYQH